MAVLTGCPPQVMISAPAAIPAGSAGPFGTIAAAITRQIIQFGHRHPEPAARQLLSEGRGNRGVPRGQADMSVGDRADILVQGEVIGFFVSGGLGLCDARQKSAGEAGPVHTLPVAEGVLARELVVGRLEGVGPGEGAVVGRIGVLETDPGIRGRVTPSRTTGKEEQDKARQDKKSAAKRLFHAKGTSELAFFTG